MKKLKVLHVIAGLGPGGAETVLYRLTTHAPGVTHEVISLAGPDWYSSKLRDNGVAVHHLNWSSPASAIRALVQLNRLIRATDADLVQAWMYRANLVAGLVGLIAGKPVVWNIRCSSLDPLPWTSRLIARAGGVLARWVPRVVINCSVQSAALHEQWGYGAAEGAVIANGYDPVQFHPDDADRAKVRKLLDLPEDSFVIGSVGRWHAQKGLPVLFRAARLLNDRGIDFRLLLAGRNLDPSNPELASLVHKSGCEGLVQLLGERGDIEELDRALDLHVLASVGSEGFPNVIAETMLSAVPNVVTQIGDSGLIVGETGWVVPAGEPKALADAIESAFREWHSSPEEWQRRREASRERIVDKFSAERMAQAYLSVWQAVADRRLGGQASSADSPLPPGATTVDPLRRSR